MITSLLAETLVSGEWLTGLVVAVIGAVGSAVVAYKKGAASATETTIKAPVPTVPMSKVSTPPSWDAHRALCDRVLRLEEDLRHLGSDVKSIKDSQAEQFRQLMVAGAEREIRISEKIEGFARAIHGRIDEYMKPQTHRRTS